MPVKGVLQLEMHGRALPRPNILHLPNTYNLKERRETHKESSEFPIIQYISIRGGSILYPNHAVL